MKKLLILSGKGGTGKTTVASSIIALSGATAIADCDVDAPNLHLVFGQGEEPQSRDFLGGKKAQVNGSLCDGCGKCAGLCRFDAVRLEEGKAHIDEIACEGCGVCRHVCPKKAIELVDDVAGRLSLYRGERIFSTARLKMGRGNSGKLVSEVKFALFGAAKDSQLAVIDGSPGIGCPVIASISGVDLVLAVTEPSVSGISDLKRLCKTADTLNARLAVCVNKYDVDVKKAEEIEDFCRQEGLDFVGRIPFDKRIPALINDSQSVSAEASPVRDALLEIYNRTLFLLQEN